ncbi:uncharacterized protein LOC135949907 [Calliphora vicina]|uniref:uncharacterized protein LOC135949907 n=1 Tax=Calliphora vicina TaxID=7373 RepID=UPI00325B53F7
MNINKRKKFWGSVPKNKIGNNTNRFKDLENLDDNDTYSEGEIEHEYKTIIPPIVVDPAHGFLSVYNKLGTAYQYKRMSIGTKVISSSESDFITAKTKLAKDEFKFYTHDLKDKKIFKLVLFGLPKTRAEEITDELKNTFNVVAVSIKVIITSRSSIDDALYMLEFDRSRHSKSDIHKIKFLGGIAVHWKNPSKGNKGPTFCTKCATYGHGTRNCFRNNTCIACGGGHDYSTCNINKTEQDGAVTFKCFNCFNKNLKNINHRADDPRCPSRKEYITMRQNLSNKIRNKTQSNSYKNPNFLSDDNPTNTEVHNTGPPNVNRSYAEALKFSNQQTNHDDLFTIDELFNIFSGAIADLRKCTTKAEQLNVVMSLLKYAI